jgi:NADPH-dependent curcumin reductase CurA
MTRRRSREVQLVEYPQREVQTSHFRIVTGQLPEPGLGDVLVRNTFTSGDPGMRLRLRESGPAG